MEDMTREEIRQLVQGSILGHLCLAHEGRAYGLPVFYAFDGTTFFFHSHHGLKDVFARSTTEACLLVTRAAGPDEWLSVQAFGPLEKVVRGAAHFRATDALMHVPFPPTWGFNVHGEPARSGDDVTIWSLRPSRWAGRKSVPREA